MKKLSKMRLLFFVLVLLGAACSSTTPPPQSNSVGSLLLAEPEPVSSRLQLVIARYTHMLYQTELQDEERAELLFQRGIVYDSIGLASLARIDFNQALRLKPDMAAAYNSIGVHMTQARQFLQAYEAFDASLDIDPQYNFAILNRAIALYYGGRSELAQKDTLAYLALNESDPIRLLWHYIVRRDIDEIAAFDMMLAQREQLDDSQWATSIIDFYLGRVNEATVVATLIEDVESQTQLNNRLCEAYFYLGKFHAYKGNTSAAANYFKLALSTNIHEYIEHRYARLELSNLRIAAREIQLNE